MKQAYTFSKEDAFQMLAKSGGRFTQIFQHGTLEIELFQPKEVDTQQPHLKDEIYIIITGSATFWHEGNEGEVLAGDCLFVPALDEHRFSRFSNDFATWVIFFGPEGGEAKP